MNEGLVNNQPELKGLTKIDITHADNDTEPTEYVAETPVGALHLLDTLNLNELQVDRDSSISSHTHEGTPRSHSSSSISSSNSGWSSVPNSYESPNQLRSVDSEVIPPIDPTILVDLENKAKLLSENLDCVNKNFITHLHDMTDCSTKCLSVFKDAVDSTCDSVDSSIKSMYALMAKCEELGRVVQPIYGIQDQIKEIKRLLDVFEKQLSDDEC